VDVARWLETPISSLARAPGFGAWSASLRYPVLSLGCCPGRYGTERATKRLLPFAAPELSSELSEAVLQSRNETRCAWHDT